MLTLSQREREGPDRAAVGRVRDYALTGFNHALCRLSVGLTTPSPSHASRGPLPLLMGEGL
jgi:hypothetical protein